MVKVSYAYDPDTHILELTFRDENGKVVLNETVTDPDRVDDLLAMIRSKRA